MQGVDQRPRYTPPLVPPPSPRLPALSRPHSHNSCSPRKHGHKTDICFNFHLKGQFSTGCLQAVGILYEALSCFPKMVPPSGFLGSKFINNYLGGKGVGESMGNCEEWRIYIFKIRSSVAGRDFPGGAVVKNPPANARVRSLVGEDLTCCGATKPMCQNY